MAGNPSTSPNEDADTSGFVWQAEELESASRDELVEHVLELQEQVQSVESDVAELRETLHFLLDLQTGSVDPDAVLTAVRDEE